MTATDKVIVCPYVHAPLSWQRAHLTIAGVSLGIIPFFKVQKRNASSSLYEAWPANELNQCMKLIWFHWGKILPHDLGVTISIYTHARGCGLLLGSLMHLDRCSRNVSIFLYICSMQRENKEQLNSLEGLSILFGCNTVKSSLLTRRCFFPGCFSAFNTCRRSAPSHHCW